MTGSESDARPTSGGEASRLPGAVERLLAVDRRRIDAAFTLVLLAFVGTLLVQTSGYGPQTRLVPLVIGVPVFAMLAVLLATQASARFAAVAGRYAAGSLFEDFSDRAEEFDLGDAGAEAGADASADARMELLAVLAWVAVLFALVVVVGFLVGAFAYLVAFYRLRARQGWVRAVGYSVLVWLFAVVVFKAVLDTPLYEGLLGVEVPLPL